MHGGGRVKPDDSGDPDTAFLREKQRSENEQSEDNFSRPRNDVSSSVSVVDIHNCSALFFGAGEKEPGPCSVLFSNILASFLSVIHVDCKTERPGALSPRCSFVRSPGNLEG